MKKQRKLQNTITIGKNNILPLRNEKMTNDFIGDLPYKLRVEMYNLINRNVIKKLYFFRNKPEQMIADMVPLLKMYKLFFNDLLNKEGDIIQESKLKCFI